MVRLMDPFEPKKQDIFVPVILNANGLAALNTFVVSVFVQPFASVIVTTYCPMFRLLRSCVVAPLFHR